MDSDDYFPDDDFFPDIDNLLDDMAHKDTDPKSSATSTAVVLYVFLLFLLEVLSQFLVLLFALHMLGSTSYMLPALVMFAYSSYVKMIFTFSLLDRMTCFISTILVMLLFSISVNKIIW